MGRLTVKQRLIAMAVGALVAAALASPARDGARAARACESTTAAC